MTKFEKAFSSARRSGKSTFVYNGRTYSTALKNDKSTTASRNTVKNKSTIVDSSRGRGMLRRNVPTFVQDFDDFLQNTQANYEQQKRNNRRQKMPRGSGVLRNDRVKNKEAIIQHKVANNVTDPYVIIDKQNNMMEVYNGDKLLESHEIGLGSVRGDGRYQVPAGQPTQYWQMPRTTPAGIFTLDPVGWSPYIGNEPMFNLLDNGNFTRVAMHSPAGPDRVSVLGNASTQDNRVSFGCISPAPGVIKHLYDDQILGKGDTAYVIPEMPGNYIARQGNHQLRTVYGGDNPSTFTSPSGFIGPVTYNESW